MNDPLAATKKELRTRLLAAWRSFPPADLATLSLALCIRVEALPEWKAARSVLLFTPMPGEIDIAPLAHAALQAGKTVAVPRTDWVGGRLTPVRALHWPLVPLKPGERAPTPPDDLREVSPASLDLIVTPGLGYDAAGRRLGRGAGFYDRFLLENGLATRAIGLVPDRLLQEQIPAGAMDAPVSIVVTETREIRSRRS